MRLSQSHQRLLLHLRHKVEEVAAPDHLDVLFGEVLLQELACELYELGSVAESADAAVAIEVGAESYVLNAHDGDGVPEVVDGIDDGGLCVLLEEAVVEGDLHDAVLLGELSHLVIGKVARMVTECAARGVAADDGVLADVECVVERLLVGVAEVDDDAVLVHLGDDLLSE